MNSTWPEHAFPGLKARTVLGVQKINSHQQVETAMRSGIKMKLRKIERRSLRRLDRLELKSLVHESETPPSVSAEANSRNEETTAALAPPSADQQIAILMVREDIKSISDLANKTIAIDVSLVESASQVKEGIVAGGGRCSFE